MTWYQELDGPQNRIRLRFKDNQGNTFGPFDVEWPEAPTKTIERIRVDHTTTRKGWIIVPGCKTRAANEASSHAAEGNTQTAIAMLADVTASNVEFGVP